jgi:ribose transport system substrate-binding protein
MNRSRKLLAGVVALAALLLVCSCSRSRHTAEEKYFLVASNIKIPYWQTAFNGLNRAATEMKLQAELVGPDTYDAAQEREHLRRAVASKPAGILLSPADPELMKGDIDAAVAAGIPVITMDSDAPGSHRLFFIGTNNYQAGLMGGRVLAKKLGGKGNVIVLTMPAQANLAERLHGYEDALAGHPEIKIVQTVDIRGDSALAFDKTMEIIESGKTKVDAFVCLEATSGKEVAEVLDRRKVQGKTVIAMDTDEGTLEWIEKGGIAATIAQKPFTMAYYGLRLLDDLHHNKPQPLDANWAQELQALVPSVIDTGATLVDRSNLSAIRKSTVAQTR